MSGFVKLYGSLLLGSSLMEECIEARWLFVCFLSVADETGFVRCQTPGSAGRLANLSVSQVVSALSALSSPDERSTTREEDGRRIVPVEGGWRVVNYLKYRELRTDSQANKARRQAKWRASTASTRDVVDATRDARDAVRCEVSASHSVVVSGEKGGVGGGEGVGVFRASTASTRDVVDGVIRANPLIGDRVARERELLNLVGREAGMTNRDGAEVMAEVTHYTGAQRSKLNPATMTDDRLLNSLIDARARVKRLEEKHGRPTT